LSFLREVPTVFTSQLETKKKRKIAEIAQATDDLAESVTAGDAGEIKKAVIKLQKSAEKEPNQASEPTAPSGRGLTMNARLRSTDQAS
jgi:hypothetical protein